MLLPGLLLLAAACGSSPTPSSAPTDPAAGTAPRWTGAPITTTGQAALVLDQLPADWRLPEDAAKPARSAHDTFVIRDFETVRAFGMTWQSAPLPFRVPATMQRFAPEGMQVFVDDRPARFVALHPEAYDGEPLWRLVDDRLLVKLADGQVTKAEVHHPGLVDQRIRLDWEEARAAGMAAADFVHHGITIGDTSREGLLLPAPATGTWRGVALPADARLLAWVSLAPTPTASRSDGVTVELVRHQGESRTVLASTTVTAVAFTRWEAALDAPAGEAIDLSIEVRPGATTTGDLLFVGAPQITGTPTADVRRVVVIVIDTLRPDHLGMYGYGLPTSPELDAWARDAVVFDRAWTPAPRTRPSFRTSTTGRRPLDAVCAPNIGAVFDAAGFATAGIVANVHLNPRFGFHTGFDRWTVDPSAKVDQQVALAKDWLTDHRDRDAYLFLHVMDPHLFYVAPEVYQERFTSRLDPLPRGEAIPAAYNRSKVYGWMARGQLSDLGRRHIGARYDGEIAYTSALLGEFLAYLDSLPGQTVVVIHNDHGEELWDHGGFEHNHTLYDEVVKAVLVIRPPGGSGSVGARSDALATLQDLAPTLYELVGLQGAPKTDGVSLVPALRGDPMDPDRALPIGYLKFEADQWGVVWRHHKYILFTGDGREELYDLRTDPAELDDLSDRVDTRPWVAAMAAAHGVDAGPGWRIGIALSPGQRLTVTLPADALTAGVLDPEAVTHRPVNQVWGETPPVRAVDVGTVTLGADRRTIEIVAGKVAKGTLWVRFAEPTPIAGATATVDAVTQPLSEGAQTVGPARLTLSTGMVIVPPPDEAEAIAVCEQRGAQEDELTELRALGYIDMHDEGNSPE